jgi:hypothetical protein
MNHGVSDLAQVYLEKMQLKSSVDDGMRSTDAAIKGQALAAIARAERAAGIVEAQIRDMQAERGAGYFTSQYRDARECATEMGRRFPNYATWLKQKRRVIMVAFCDGVIEKRKVM